MAEVERQRLGAIAAANAAAKEAKRAAELHKPTKTYPVVRVHRSKMFYPGQIDEK
jgi:hypothetical protein